MLKEKTPTAGTPIFVMNRNDPHVRIEIGISITCPLKNLPSLERKELVIVPSGSRSAPIDKLSTGNLHPTGTYVDRKLYRGQGVPVSNEDVKKQTPNMLGAEAHHFVCPKVVGAAPTGS